MKSYGKLYALAAAGFMTLSAFGSAPVFADGEETPAPTPEYILNTDIVKNLDLKDATLNAPAAVFNFTVTSDLTVPANGEKQKLGDTENSVFDVFPGVTDGLVVVGSANNPVQTAKDPSVYKYSGASLGVDASKFTVPGVYRYKLKEADFTKANPANDDITKDGTEYTVDVYVLTDDAGKIAPTQMLIYTADGKLGNPVFNNNLATTVSSNTLTVTKIIDGNQGVKGKEFEFTITVNGAAGDKFKVSTDNGATWKDMAATEGGVNTFETKLSNEKSVVIKGLSASDTYSIVEKKEDYTQTINGADKTDNGNATGKVDTGADNVIFTNTKNGDVPTGILLTAAPYAGMVGLGAIFAGAFFRRKREED